MIYVTGAGGFIGQNLVKSLLQDRYEVIAIDYENMWKDNGAKWMTLRDFTMALVNGFKVQPEVVIHLAACTDTTEYDNEVMMNANFVLPLNIADYCYSQKVRLVYASSAAVYGNLPSMAEDGLVKPLNIYGEAKRDFDVLMAGRNPKDTYGLRFFNVYGPHEDHKGKMASMVTQMYHRIKRDGYVELFGEYNGYGPGEQARDFIHIEDVCHVIRFFASGKRKESGVYNVGTGHATTFNEVAETLFHEMGVTKDIRYIPFPESLKDKYQFYTKADLHKLRRAGYLNHFSCIHSGVNKLVESLSR